MRYALMADKLVPVKVQAPCRRKIAFPGWFTPHSGIGAVSGRASRQNRPESERFQGFLTHWPGLFSTYCPDGVLRMSFSAASFSTALSVAPGVLSAMAR